MTNRRMFLRALAVGLATPRSVNAQPATKVWRIGTLQTLRTTDPLEPELWGYLYQALHERGYVEDRNFVFEPRSAEGVAERLPALAAELVRANVDLILAFNTPAALAAKQATRTIPIVLVGGTDPVGSGLVESLGRPGGNVTGIANYLGDLTGKRLELLKALVPKATRIAIVSTIQGFEAERVLAQHLEQDSAAQFLGVTLGRVELDGPTDFAKASAALVRERPDGVVLGSNAANFGMRREIAEFAIGRRLPISATRREEAAAGAFMSYGPGFPELFRYAVTYLDKIMKGAKPGDLPIEQPSKFELVINLRTAKALGLTIPQSMLLRADEVIR